MIKLLKISIAFLILHSVCICPVLAGDTSLEFRTLTIRDGLSGRIVFDVCQDTAGYVWIGTDAGLDRYDGYSMISYCHITGDRTSLCNSCVTNIFEDSGGRLWIGTSDGLSIYDRDSDSFHTEEWTGGMYVRHIFEDGYGSLWIATNKGCLLYRDGRWTRFHSNADAAFRLPDDYVTSIMQFGDDIWIGAGTYICTYSYSTGRFHSTPAPETVPGETSSVYWLCRGDGSKAYVGTNMGLYEYDADSGSWRMLLDQVIRHLTLKKGKLWISTQNGLFIYDVPGENIDHYYHIPGRVDSLADNLIWSVDFTRDGTAWVATENGVSVATGSKKSAFISLASIVDWDISANVQNICRDENGRLWLGTTRSVIVCTEDNGKYSGEEMLQGYNIRDIYEDRHGYMWLATDGGLFSCDLETGHTCGYDIMEPSGSYKSDWVYSIAEDSLDRQMLWIGTFDDGIFCMDRKKLNPDSTRESLMADRHYGTGSLTGRMPSNLISSMLVDGEGSIWVSTNDKGLCRINAGTGGVDSFTTENSGLCSNDIGKMKMDRTGTIWIPTDSGLCRLDPETCTVSRAADMVSGKIIDVEPENGNLWIISNAGISRYDTGTSAIQTLQVEDAVYNTLYYDGDHTVFIGCNDGILRVDTDSLDSVHAAPVSITGISVDNRFIKRSAGPDGKTILSVVLPYRLNSISVSVSTFDFSVGSHTPFAYRLEGYDDKVNFLAGDSNVVSYLNIPPGKYELLVSSGTLSLSDGGAGLSIRILRPWYASVTAYAMYFILLGILVLSVFRYLSKKRQAAIEQDNTERTLKYARMELSFYKKVASDFKSPLSLIIGQTRLLGNSADARNLRHELGIIMDNAIKIRSTVDEMLSHKGELFCGFHVDYPEGGDGNGTEAGSKDTVMVFGIDMEKSIYGSLVANCTEKFKFIYYGASGLETKIIEEETPNVILVDDTFPDRDSIHICHMIKESKGLEYIPVLVVRKDEAGTAGRMLKLAGADIVIPVSSGIQYIAAMIEYYIGNERSDKPDFSEDDGSIFLASLVKAVTENMDNENLDMARLSEIMKTGRKQLYRKTKQLAGVTTVEFIRMLRLSKAADLCRNSSLTISEIMYSVGFSNHSYFTKCFKEEYHVTPKEYVRMYRES